MPSLVGAADTYRHARSQDGSISLMFAEPLAAVEVALERWHVAHYAHADNLDRAAAGLDATANGAEAAETDAVAAAGRVEPGTVTSANRGPDLTQQVESHVRGTLKPGDEIAHEWRNDETLAAHARRGVDTSDTGRGSGGPIDGNGEVVEKSCRAVSWTRRRFRRATAH